MLLHYVYFEIILVILCTEILYFSFLYRFPRQKIKQTKAKIHLMLEEINKLHLKLILSCRNWNKSLNIQQENENNSALYLCWRKQSLVAFKQIFIQHVIELNMTNSYVFKQSFNCIFRVVIYAFNKTSTSEFLVLCWNLKQELKNYF